MILHIALERYLITENSIGTFLQLSLCLGPVIQKVAHGSHHQASNDNNKRHCLFNAHY